MRKTLAAGADRRRPRQRERFRTQLDAFPDREIELGEIAYGRDKAARWRQRRRRYRDGVGLLLPSTVYGVASRPSTLE